MRGRVTVIVRTPFSNAFSRYWVGAFYDRGDATKLASVFLDTPLNSGMFTRFLPEKFCADLFRVRLRLEPPGVQNWLVVLILAAQHGISRGV